MRGAGHDRAEAAVAATGLLASILLAGALVIAMEATAELSRTLGLVAVLLGAILLGAGITALVWDFADRDDRS